MPGAGHSVCPFGGRGMRRGWGPTAMAVWRKLGALHAARVGQSPSQGVDQLLQALGVALQRENARAVLRRLPEGADATQCLEDP